MALAVAQVVEWLLLTPEVCSLNPVIGNIDIEQCLPSTVLKRRKIKKKETGNCLFFKKEIPLSDGSKLSILKTKQCDQIKITKCL